MRTKWMVLLGMLIVSALAMAQNTANSSFQIKGTLLDSLLGKLLGDKGACTEADGSAEAHHRHTEQRHAGA